VKNAIIQNHLKKVKQFEPPLQMQRRLNMILKQQLVCFFDIKLIFDFMPTKEANIAIIIV
jgi:hypothetical protein